ncbi:DUF3150 domain-containing protein [Sinimarinibacterium sp. CAU 1509]|uniref:DUF3150 domain-containing protein n=1 Tax=Sinimarinibacterium sp. CAU 1509 TaxID=2562283 RepID=UPI0010AC6247|nr:DUF3150 domain-containing protein [Sinimarinibacterium sp. CAU 1509]TJY57279.1 DUF3150 domain-containing protein [Sinimarinibacterium sp. CAU 1509]
MSNSNSNSLLRGDLVAVRFVCHQVSSTRVLDPSVLGEILGTLTLPPGVEALLRQHVFAAESLRPFGRIEKSIRDWLFVRSTSTELGYIISPDRVGEVAKRLDEARAEYEREVPALLAQYDAACRATDDRLRADFAGASWLPALLAAVAEARPAKEYVAKAVGMEFFMFHIGQIDDGFDADAEGAVQSGVICLRKDLPGLAVAEVARYYSALKKDLDERAASTLRQSTVRRAARGAEKLHAMSFLDTRIGVLASKMEVAFKSFAREGADVLEFRSLVERLASQRHLAACMERGIDPTVGVAAPKLQGTLSLPSVNLQPVTAPVMGPVPVQVLPAAPQRVAPTPMQGVPPVLTGGLFG